MTHPEAWHAPPRAATSVQSLDIVSIGLVAERNYQSDVWKLVKEGKGKKIVSDDPKLYFPWVKNTSEIGSQRHAAALEWCLGPFVEAWPIPNVEMNRIIEDREFMDQMSRDDFIHDLRQPAGLHWHENTKVAHVFSDMPDDVLERAFQFFDVNPDAPALLIFGFEASTQQADRQPTDSTESVACIIFAKRDRVDWLRNFAPYARKPDDTIYPGFWKWRSEPPVPFTPTKFIPKPWTQEQLAQFDGLPTLAVVHRPVVVPLEVPLDGAAVPAANAASGVAAVKMRALSADERTAAVRAAWPKLQAQLAGAGSGGGARPRVFYDHGSPASGRAILPLTTALVHGPQAEGRWPAIDLFDFEQAINTFNVLGDTRSAAPMMQWALASFAVADTKRPAITVNLRDPARITFTVLTPDLSQQNQERLHPGGTTDFPLRPFN